MKANWRAAILPALLVALVIGATYVVFLFVAFGDHVDRSAGTDEGAAERAVDEVKVAPDHPRPIDFAPFDDGKADFADRTRTAEQLAEILPHVIGRVVGSRGNPVSDAIVVVSFTFDPILLHVRLNVGADGRFRFPEQPKHQRLDVATQYLELVKDPSKTAKFLGDGAIERSKLRSIVVSVRYRGAFAPDKGIFALGYSDDPDGTHDVDAHSVIHGGPFGSVADLGDVVVPDSRELKFIVRGADGSTPPKPRIWFSVGDQKRYASHVDIRADGAGGVSLWAPTYVTEIHFLADGYVRADVPAPHPDASVTTVELIPLATVVVQLPDAREQDVRCSLFKGRFEPVATTVSFDDPWPTDFTYFDTFSLDLPDRPVGRPEHAARTVTFKNVPFGEPLTLVYRRSIFDGATDHDYATATIAPVAAGERRVVVAPTPPPLSVLRGRASDAHGAPLAYADVVIRSYEARTEFRTTADGDGKFEKAGVPRGRVEARVNQGGVSVAAGLELSAPEEFIALELPPSRIVTLRVVEMDGRPPETEYDAMVESDDVRNVDAKAAARHAVGRTEARARFLGEGRYEAEVAVDRDGAFRVMFAGRRLRASFAADQSEAMLTLPNLGELVLGVAPLPFKRNWEPPIIEVYLRDLDDPDRPELLYASLSPNVRAKSSGGGEAPGAESLTQIVPLAPGRYEIRTAAVDRRYSKDVHIPAFASIRTFEIRASTRTAIDLVP